ncbi:MAG: recombinase family protein [Actinomycetota bacterium]
MPVAIGYARLSVADTDSTSIERQRQLIEERAHTLGHPLVAVEIDDGVSGSIPPPKRPGFGQVIEVLDRGEADVLIVASLDRLARSVLGFASLVEDLGDRGVDLVLIREAMDTSTAQGRVVLSILAALAAFEREQVGERVAAARAHLRRLGRFPGGRVPYGWRSAPSPDGPGKVLLLDPETSDHLLAAVQVLLDGGSLNKATQAMHAAGGPKWPGGNLRPVLASPALMGHATVKDVDDWRRPYRSVLDDAGEPVMAREPLLDLVTFQALQDALGARERDTPLPRSDSSWLSGAAVCAGCGRPCYDIAPVKHGRRRLQCQHNGCPRPGGMATDDAEAIVTEALSALDGVTLTEVVVTDPNEARRSELEAELDWLAETIAAASPRLRGRLLERAERIEEELDGMREATQSTVDVGNFGELWASADRTQRRTLVRLAFDSVEVGQARDPERLVLTWRLVEEDPGA